MDNKQYRLEDATVEDQIAFKSGMDKLLSELSLVASIIVNKKSVTALLEDGSSENIYVDTPVLLIQRKAKIDEINQKA